MRPSLGRGKCTLLYIERCWVKIEFVANNLPRFVVFASTGEVCNFENHVVSLSYLLFSSGNLRFLMFFV